MTAGPRGALGWSCAFQQERRDVPSATGSKHRDFLSQLMQLHSSEGKPNLFLQMRKHFQKHKEWGTWTFSVNYSFRASASQGCSSSNLSLFSAVTPRIASISWIAICNRFQGYKLFNGHDNGIQQPGCTAGSACLEEVTGLHGTGCTN